jgi:hypothetical protein
MIEEIVKIQSSFNLKAFFIRTENSVLFLLLSRFLRKLPSSEREGPQSEEFKDRIEEYHKKLDLDYIEQELSQVRSKSLSQAQVQALI